MRSLFTIHAGEYLVGTYIEEHYKNINVWIPSKDTGIDLLLTNKSNKKNISVQVKFSKDFLGSLGSTALGEIASKVKSGGWFKYRKFKLGESLADFWVIVLYKFTQKDFDFVVIEPNELLRRLTTFGKKTEVIQSYIWVTKNKRCWETRGLKNLELLAISNDSFVNSDRDLSEYLNNWKPIEQRLFQN